MTSVGMLRGKDEQKLYVVASLSDIDMKKVRMIGKGNLIFPEIGFAGGKILLSYDITRYAYRKAKDALVFSQRGNSYRLFVPLDEKEMDW